MTSQDRRQFLGSMIHAGAAGIALTAFPPAIQRALAIPANVRTGTIQDVEHIVILMQENRAFDHYFGSLNGVRGFADPFPIPVPDSTRITGKTVWSQPSSSGPNSRAPVIVPFRANTVANFALMRISGTPHSWSDAQAAWDHGRMSKWPAAKGNHSLAYFNGEDMPFQYALANAFTLCDAYHCSAQTGTNPNRLFLWTGTNDGLATGNGPATYNDYDWFDADNGDGGYTWTTYPERLEAAGISWQVYENMSDNFTDNPLAGFHGYRDAWFQRPGYSQALRDRGVSTRDLDKLREDVLANKLPQVSWIVATAEGSEHPGPSSPAQGADYTARVLDALTSNPEVWSKTVLFINFDENDGFFDHVPPPAPPSYLAWDADPAKAVLAGATTADATGEYHEVLVPYHNNGTEQALLHRPYGLGPRVPMYVVSPWSKGGWVNSEVFDHTSVLSFIERRFGVRETNVTAWRRAVCGDLTSTFNFADPDDRAFFESLPKTLELATRARALVGQRAPLPPTTPVMPVQADGPRPSRALPYELHAHCRITPDRTRVGATNVQIVFENTGNATAVFHVYNRLDLAAIPRRYTVEPGRQLQGAWTPASSGAYDLWVLGPNGFHRHFVGNARRVAAAAQANPEVIVSYNKSYGDLVIDLVNSGSVPCTFVVEATRYFSDPAATHTVPARSQQRIYRSLNDSGRWYDFTVKVQGQAEYRRRVAGRLENGLPSISDPTMSGPAVQDR